MWSLFLNNISDCVFGSLPPTPYKGLCKTSVSSKCLLISLPNFYMVQTTIPSAKTTATFQSEFTEEETPLSWVLQGTLCGSFPL